MLVLSRKEGETIRVGDDIELRVIEVKGETVRLGIDAPKSVEILRGELIESIGETNTEASNLQMDLFNRLKKEK